MTIVATLGSSGGGGGSGGTLIQAQTVSNVASITFTTGFTYNNYKLLWYNYLQATNTQDMQLLISQDGGATFSTTNYVSGIKISGYNNSGWGAAATTSATTLAYGMDLTVSAGEADLLQFGIASPTVFPIINGLNTAPNNNQPQTTAITSWNTGATAPINAIKIQPASGNITSGTFLLYGIPG